MIENIKELYAVMNSESKKSFIDALVDYYGMGKKSVLQNWMYKGDIPIKKQPKVVEIAQLTLKKQQEITLKKLNQ